MRTSVRSLCYGIVWCLSIANIYISVKDTDIDIGSVDISIDTLTSVYRVPHERTQYTFTYQHAFV